MRTKVSLFLSTCDSHSDLWPSFFFLLMKYWKCFDLQIILCTESKPFSCPPFNFIYPKGFPLKRNIPWGSLNLKALHNVNTEYILLMLEDDFIESPINEEEISNILSFLDKNTDVACVSFKPTPRSLKIKESLELPGYYLCDDLDDIKANLQVGIWRTSHFKKIIKKHESPWEFERWASLRVRRIRKKIYAKKSYNNLSPIDYAWGDPVVKGVWNEKEIKRIKEKTGFDISLNSVRSSLPTKEIINANKKTNKKHITFKKIIRSIKSII